MPTLPHLRSATDLVTTDRATSAGFLALALERSNRAVHYVEQARALKAAARLAGTPDRLVQDTSLKAALLTAAGVSDKAASHLTEDGKQAAIKKFIDSFLEPAGDDFVDELVFRFLLTKGDALGGKMRNVGGQLAHAQFVRALFGALQLTAATHYWLDEDRTWRPATDISQHTGHIARGLSWESQGKNRTLMFNRRIAVVGTNVDICLLNCERSLIDTALENPGAFVAMGELKGGIDPAGADEHWKTARAALTRIHSQFSSQERYPHLFFVGAAIANRMANEIWERLGNNTLANAANLTDAEQVASLVQWLTNL